MKNSSAATVLAHRVSAPTTTEAAKYQVHCDGCGWIGEPRNAEFAAELEGMMHEFNGNGGASR